MTRLISMTGKRQILGLGMRTFAVCMSLVLHGCSSSPTNEQTSSAAVAACDPGAEDPSLLFYDVFLRSTGSPVTETRTFASEGNASARICVEATGVGSATVALNGNEVFGKHELKGDVTLTKSVSLEPASTLAVQIVGKPCNGKGACASVRIRVFGPARPPPQAVSQSAPDGCCNDPACDRRAFAERGGICPGDPRIRGPLPHHAPAMSAP